MSEHFFETYEFCWSTNDVKVILKVLSDVNILSFQELTTEINHTDSIVNPNLIRLNQYLTTLY